MSEQAMTQLEPTMTELEAENAKLREYATKLEQANIVLDSDNCDLKNDMKDMQFFIDENRKLRELVRDMWHLLFDWLFKNHEVPWKELEAAHDRMCELGVEL